MPRHFFESERRLSAIFAALVGLGIGFAGENATASIHLGGFLCSAQAGATSSVVDLRFALSESAQRSQTAKSPDSTVMTGSGSQPQWLVEYFLNMNCEMESLYAQYLHFCPNSGGTSNCPSSTSSSGSLSGLSVAMLAPSGDPALDDGPLQRYAAECKLLLPDAPGTKLFRPPRG